jgi:hypothetical protein
MMKIRMVAFKMSFGFPVSMHICPQRAVSYVFIISFTLLSHSSFYRSGFLRMVFLFLITVMSSSTISPLDPRAMVTDTLSPLSSHSSLGKKKKDLPTWSKSAALRESFSAIETAKQKDWINITLK